MGKERGTASDARFNRVNDFIELSLQGEGSCIAALKGYWGKDYVDFSNYITLSYPKRDWLNRKRLSIFFERKSNNLQKIYDEILGLNVPKPIAKVYEDIGEKPDLCLGSMSYFASNNMPYSLLGLGGRLTTKEGEELPGKDIVILFFPPGAMPGDALSEIQKEVFNQKLSLNLFQPQKLSQTYSHLCVPSETFDDVWPGDLGVKKQRDHIIRAS